MPRKNGTRTPLCFDAIYNRDCIEGMALLPPACVDLIITDPPFAIEFKARRSNYNRTGGRVLDGYNEVAADDYGEFTRQWMIQAARILKDSGSMYVFSGWNNLKHILVTIDELGLTTVNHLIWKYQFGVVTSRRFVTSHYHCLYVCKNDSRRKFFPYARFPKDQRSSQGGSAHYKDKEDVWVINREYWSGDKKTPTKLPAEVIRKILAYSSEPGDLVCDPFLGSGQVAVVSKMENRKFVGFEIVPEYFEFAQERLRSGRYRIDADDGSDAVCVTGDTGGV
jgi:site-specific DNA-methyltransferase (adenine-specific)